MLLSANRAVEVLRAAGETTRMRILALLAREELAVLEIHAKNALNAKQQIAAVSRVTLRSVFDREPIVQI